MRSCPFLGSCLNRDRGSPEYCGEELVWNPATPRRDCYPSSPAMHPFLSGEGCQKLASSFRGIVHWEGDLSLQISQGCEKG